MAGTKSDVVAFSLDGKEFEADRSALTSYKVTKMVANAENDPCGYFEAMERIFMGRDEEYVERVGGMDGLAKLNDAATEAVKAKNSSASSRASKRTGAK